MSLPYLDTVEKHIDKWFNAGWLVYAIIGLSVFTLYVIVRVLVQ